MSQEHYSGPQVHPLSTADVDAVVDLSLRAWEPVFASFNAALGNAIYRRLYPDWQVSQAKAVREVCLDEAMECFVVIDTDTVAGFVALTRQDEPSMGIVEMVAVDPEFQRRGNGRALMQFAVRYFNDKHIPLINVATGGDPGHAPARRLYESVGFQGLPFVNYYLSSGGRLSAESISRQ